MVIYFLCATYIIKNVVAQCPIINKASVSIEAITKTINIVCNNLLYKTLFYYTWGILFHLCLSEISQEIRRSVLWWHFSFAIRDRLEQLGGSVVHCVKF